MDPQTSAYQAFKLWLTGHVPLDRNTIHYLIGAALMMAAALRARRRPGLMPFAIALVLATVAGAAMEWADRRDDLAALGHWRWRASLIDLGRTIAFPALGFCVMLIRFKNRGRDG